MSLFRRPGDSSSSSDSDDQETSHDEQEISNDGQADIPPFKPSLLSRVNSLQAGLNHSGRATPHPALNRSGRATPHPTQPGLSRSSSHVRDLLLHALLEEKTVREAAELLGKDPSSPEVQQLAKATYQALARQIPGAQDDQYISDVMRATRAAIQEGLGAATRNHIAALTGMETGGSSRALAPRGPPIRGLSSLNPLFSSLPSVHEIPLQNFPGLHTDRYVREFVELQVVGKGGYGTVFKVKHKLDNSYYAVKRIAVTPARWQRIKEEGPHEIEKMLEEVRALARFDHGNIVRYHNCWLEFNTTTPAIPPSTSDPLRPDLLLEQATSATGDGLSFDVRTLSISNTDGCQPEDSTGIVFEYSESGEDAEAVEQEPPSEGQLKTPDQRQRSGSLATIGTVSSARSRQSAVESDDEVETIPRPHAPRYPRLSSEMTESMMSDSDSPTGLVMRGGTGPVLTLNVQMSLYETNLADFLSFDHTANPNEQLHHCFHTRVSLELLLNIISGVEYLHAQGVVHRDLKPANVFLAVTASKIPPSGSTDLSSCTECPQRDCVYVTPRIGDFGLVAALGDPGFALDGNIKPVGTEFYRPEGGDSQVSEKLDVFALGVVCFELLWKFSTRMERAQTLTRLRHGHFPENFADRVGVEVQALIGEMVCPDEHKRLTCEEVRDRLRQVIAHLRMEQS